MKLETIIANKITNESVYMAFPMSRHELMEKLKEIKVDAGNWYVRGVRVGCNDFGMAVINCHNFDELNYLSYAMHQFDEEEDRLFFKLSKAGCAQEHTVSGYINMAFNIKNYFCVPGISNAEQLGRWCLTQYLKTNDVAVEDVYITEADYDELGTNFYNDKCGRFYRNSFFGRKLEWKEVYNGDEEQIPDFLCIDSIRI